MNIIKQVVLFFLFSILIGCASNNAEIQKLAKPVDRTAGEIVKVREIKRDGETRAVFSPADSKQLKITF